PLPDDLGAGEELVAPAMIAVVMRVDDPSRRRLQYGCVFGDQRTRVRQVPEGVDHEPAAAVDEPRVTGAEAAIRLEADVHVGCDPPELHTDSLPPGRAPGQLAGTSTMRNVDGERRERPRRDEAEALRLARDAERNRSIATHRDLEGCHAVDG